MLSQASLTSEDWPGVVLDASSPTTTGTSVCSFWSWSTRTEVVGPAPDT